MGDRYDVAPHHLLRAALDDRFVRDLLARVGTPADELRLTLEQRWLEAAVVVGPEEVAALGIELDLVLGVLNPPVDHDPPWGGRHLTQPAREVLIHALWERSLAPARRAHAGHLLLGLMASRDRLVRSVFDDHGLQARDLRPLVAAWGRRAGDGAG